MQIKKIYLNLFRIDDVCDYLPNVDNVMQLIRILNRYNIKPLLGIVPNVEDKDIIDKNSNFKLEDLIPLIEKNKIDIALHGYNHKYITKNGGILDLNKRSEFAGLSYDQQKRKIADGLKIIKDRLNVEPKYFFAPAHSYDLNTLKVLKEFNLVNVDGISLFPFEHFGVFHIPQQRGYIKERFLWFKFGVFVNHFHPKTITEKVLNDVEKFCNENREYLANFDEILENKVFYLKLNQKYRIHSEIFKKWFHTKRFLYKLKIKVLK